MPTVNYVICTYSGKYDRKFKRAKRNVDTIDKYLQFNLAILNKFHNNLTQITIMRPKVNPEHTVIPDYYDFSKINISNIKDKIKIIDCENIGVSYGQFITCLNMFRDQFDYHIFIEDDYAASCHNFDQILISNYLAKVKQTSSNVFLCAGIVKNPDKTLQTLEWADESIVVADFSLGILSKLSAKMLFDKFTYKQMMDAHKRLVGKDISHSQILFSWQLKKSDVLIVDYCNKFMSIFYCSGGDVFKLLNYEKKIWRLDNPKLWSHNPILLPPIFLPLQLFFPVVRESLISICQKNTLGDTKSNIDLFRLK